MKFIRKIGASVCMLCALRAFAVDISGSVVDQHGAPVADAVLTATPATRSAATRYTEQIDQIDKEFVPLVTVLRTGSSVIFLNHDTVQHQIYSFSPAKKFDLPLYAKTTPPPVLFDKPGIVIIGCNIHDWMLAYIDVVDTPYFAKTDDKGFFTISNLPRGQYTVRAWHPNLTDAQSPPQNVAIDADNITLGTLALHLETPAPRRHAPWPSQRDY